MSTYSSDGAGKTLDTIKAAASVLSSSAPIGSTTSFKVPSASASATPGGSKPAAKKPPSTRKK